MRTAFFCLLTALLGLSLGLAINYEVLGEFLLNQQSIVTSTVSPSVAVDTTTATNNNGTIGFNTNEEEELVEEVFVENNEALIEVSYAIINALKSSDYATLSQYIHPESGVRFTPYSTVDIESDITLMPIELSRATSNSTLFVWGLQDGSGLPIQMTITEYFASYVYNEDFSTAPYLSINKVLSSGNSLENVTSAYPDADFVEFYLPQVSPTSGGFDWCALKLVFEVYEDSYKLIGLIHSQWTI